MAWLFAEMHSFVQELHRRNAVFYYLGIAFSILFVLFALSIGYCLNAMNDICLLLKPCKFAISFALYVVTLGWYLEYLKESLGEATIKRITWLVAALIFAEMILLFMESGLSTSIYEKFLFSPETTTAVSRGFYLAFNTIIIANSFVTVYVAACFFRPLSLKPTIYLWGIRAAFLIFIVSSFLGGYMLHEYGQDPGDPTQFGLPFTHLLTYRNNLTTLHFLGVHCLQILPLCCYYFDHYVGKKILLSATGLYVMVCVLAVLI